jgi:hypothetical protein
VFNRSNAFTVSNGISGDGLVTKKGAGRMTVNGNNSGGTVNWNFTGTGNGVECTSLGGGNALYAVGNILATGNITAYSDIRLKTDLKLIDSPLEKIRKLAGYTYTRKDSGERQTGLVAQDVQKVLPEAVSEDKEGNLSIAYGNLVGLLVEAIKELDRRST